MAGPSEVSQVLRLNATQYRGEITKTQTETRSSLQKINKDLVDSGNAFRDYSNYVKKQTSSMIGAIEDAGKAFAKNLGKGALAGGALAGFEAMRGGAKEAIRTGLAFDDALARVASRADLTKDKVAKLKQEFFELGKTGAKLETIPAAFDAIYSATGNVDQSRSVMDPIAKAAAMGNGDAGEMADFVKDRLKGEGKDINKGNVQELLQALVLAQRGGEFNSMSDAMQGMSGIDAAAQRRAGLSDKDLAGILAGSTRAGADKATGLAAAQALVHMSQQGFGGGAALSGLLGVSSLMSHGKFDSSKLNVASANLKRSGRSDSDNIALLQTAGLSEQESTGLLAILKNVQKFQAGVNKVATDTKSFDQSFQEVTDTVSHHLEELKNATIHGFSDIFSPLMGMLNQVLGGHIPTNMLGAVGDTAIGMAKHPLLVGGGLLATAAGGAMLSKLGLGGGLAKGVAEGKALQSGAGVSPVYVVNAGEIGEASKEGDFFDKTSKMATGGGAAAAEGTVGIGSLVAGLAIPITGALGAVGLAAYAAKHPESDLAQHNIASQSAAAGIPLGLQENPRESTYDREHRLKIEVVSKDPAYMAIPKRTDNPRDPRGM